QIQSLILGNISTFTNGLLWRFFSSYGGSAASPWPITQTRTYASLSTSPNQDFTACKLGDVNDSWNSAIPRPAPGSPAAELRLLPLPAAPGQPLVVRLELLTHGTDPHALQATLVWDPAVLRLRTPAPAAPGLAFGQPDHSTGRLPLLWTEPATGPTPDLRLAQLTFDVIGATPTGTTELAFTDGPTPSLAADNALEPLGLTLTPLSLPLPARPTSLTDTPEPASLQLAPNPATTRVRITGYPATGPLPVELLDALGRPVRHFTTPSPHHPATLDLSGLPPGLYLVRVGRQTQRLVIE
ncbi:MAG TPA: T9SS type A sorting domain-containing protein, partial [bacterium]|nr:T9SS type A sorting domain-containing protein [bacterium]